MGITNFFAGTITLPALVLIFVYIPASAVHLASDKNIQHDSSAIASGTIGEGSVLTPGIEDGSIDIAAAEVHESQKQAVVAVGHASFILELHREAITQWKICVFLTMLGCTAMWVLHRARPKVKGKMSGGEDEIWCSTYLAQIVVMSASSSFLFIEFPRHAVQIGLEPLQVATVLGCFSLGHILALLAYPALSRLASARVLCASAALIRVAVFPAFAREHNLYFLVFCRTLWGASCGTAQSASMCFLQSRCSKPKDLKRCLEFEDQAVSIGAILGCCVGAFLFAYTYAAPFWVASTVNLVLACAVFGVFVQPAEEKQSKEGVIVHYRVMDMSDCLLRRKVPYHSAADWAPETSPMSAVDAEASKETLPPAISVDQTRPQRTEGEVVSDLDFEGFLTKSFTYVWVLVSVSTAAGSLALATLATTFWEPLLSPYTQLLSARRFTSLELGVVWASLFALQALFQVPATRLTSAAVRCAALRDESAVISGPWLVTYCGWVLVALGALVLVATPPPPKGDGSLMSFGTSVSLIIAGAALVRAPSMACLLQATRPLGKATWEKWGPDTWIAAYCLGEATGPIAAAIAVMVSLSPADVGTSTISFASAPAVTCAAKLGALIAGCVLFLISIRVLVQSMYNVNVQMAMFGPQFPPISSINF